MELWLVVGLILIVLISTWGFILLLMLKEIKDMLEED